MAPPKHIQRSGNLSRAIRAVLSQAAKQRSMLGAMSLAMSAAAMPVYAQELPNPCAAGACGGAISTGATSSSSGNTLNVHQHASNAVLHWQSFNIGEGGVVNFHQPNASAVALNRIYQNDPSRILGSLNANGRVYLLNQNGFVFGQNSRINVGGLIASSLNLSQAAVDNGIAEAINNGRQPAFTRFLDDNGSPVASGGIEVQAGARISAADGGEIMMFAPQIENRGTLTTPGGQTLLAAGNTVYLATNRTEDRILRGMLVEVGMDVGDTTVGLVQNGDEAANATVTDPANYVGQIIAERGNVTIAGLAVNQFGRVSATTTVRENGSIRLQARAGGNASGGQIENRETLNLSGSVGGQLQLGTNSLTEVRLSTSSEVAVDSTEQLRSKVSLQGRSVIIGENARVAANGGSIDVVARAQGDPVTALFSGTANDGSRIYVADGATLDVSGANIELAMERNVISAELRGDELADSPLQRNGVLRGQAVNVDIRQGTPIGNVSGQIGLIERTVAERNLIGGTVSMQSQGDAILAAGSTVDISGGSIRYRDGFINTTMLLGADGRAYNIADADPNRIYTGIANGSVSVTNSRWGVTRTYVGIGRRGNFERGYVEGKDAGTFSLNTPLAILDGAVRAEVQAGRYQRYLAEATPTDRTVEDVWYRPFNQVPLGGAFNFGRTPTRENTDRVGGNVEFGGGLILPSLNGFNPHTDVLPTTVNATRLRGELFGEDRIARVDVKVNGNVTAPENLALRLPGQGQLNVSAGSIAWAADVIAPSGTLSFDGASTATTSVGEIGIDIAGTALFDLSGRWVNDSVRFNPQGGVFDPLFIDGGAVSMQASSGSLRLESGSVIDVSAGAWAHSNGRITTGDSGSIKLEASGFVPVAAGEQPVLQLSAALRGYGFDDGGSLTISAPEVCVAADGVCGSSAPSTLQLMPEQLLAGGFADITLESNTRGLTVEAGTVLNLRQRNRIINRGALSVATGASLGTVASIGTLPDYLRSAANLQLTTSIDSLRSNDGSGGLLDYDNQTFSAAPNLTIETGARISADPLARIGLQSNSRILVDGSITARGGVIDLKLDNTLSIGQTLNSQGIWLGDSARLDVSGTSLLQPNIYGLRIGQVLNGGTVNIEAQRGAIIANQGSSIDVSGVTATLDVFEGSGLHTATPTAVASNGGQVNFIASDAILMNGEINARAGDASTTARGGALRVELDAQSRYGNQADLPLPVEQRRVVVAQESEPVSVAAGASLPSSFANQARVSADMMTDAGFADAAFIAGTTQGSIVPNGPIVTEVGQVEFNGDVRLAMPRSLVLDAARITGNGNVELSAAYVSVGHSDRSHQLSSPAPAASGLSTLQVNGAFVEVVGNSTIDGFGAVRLNSVGDLRLRGVQAASASQITGSLRTNADLTLRADQVYATTLSDFDLAIEGNPSGVLRVESNNEPRDTVLSAGSRLTLTAPTIEQAGVLRAPFGVIELNADDVRLEAGSLTSTSAEGAVIPFGAIQAGEDWVYSLQGQTLVLGSTLDAPEKAVSLNGARIDVNAGATIDVSGGGDLLAYEFQPGVTGKQDALSALERPGRFAIVPSLRLSQAPFDPQESLNSTLSVGDSIHLSAGVNGLPPGDYVLLPARYALLEGAYVVEAVSGYTDLASGTALRQINGSSIVSGYRHTANTNFRDARRSGFIVTPGSVVATEARYDTARASSFFAERAQRAGEAAPRLPNDAGVLSIAAVSQLNLDGALRATATNGGRGAAVDIAAQDLLIANTGVGTGNQVVVSATDLNALGAESVLLGGLRSSSADGVAVNTSANTVTIAAGVTLAAPEMILTANDTVRVEASATLTASGNVPVTDNYVLNGDGAFLRLAAGEQTAITRNGETGTRGTLIVSQGATLQADGGALAMDASLDTQSQASVSLNQGSLSLGASRINLGAAPLSADGLTLDAEALSELNLNELVLASRSSIDLYGSVVLQVNDLAFDGAGLRAQTGGTDAGISAVRSIALSNRDERTDTAASALGGALTLSADRIEIGAGEQSISGFQNVTLDAESQVRLSSQRRVLQQDGDPVAGGLAVSGNLNMQAPTVLAARGSATQLRATGDVQISSTAATPALAQSQELGGAIEVKGRSVSVGTRIEAAAGSIDMTADTGDVVLNTGAVLDVAGRTRDFDGVIVAAGAGDVSLAATQGNVTASAGSILDVSAAADGEAGSLSATATQGAVTLAGELRGSAQSNDRSGRVSIDAQTLGSVSALNSSFNAGGFNAERNLRQRGAGDLVVASTDTFVAERAVLTADQGSVLVSGTIDARGADGGDVVLSARDNVVVAGSINASATQADGSGGEVDLRADAGTVLVNSGASINVTSGAQSDDGGELRLRVSRDVLTDADTANDVVLAGNVSGAERTTLEGFQRYTDTDLGLVGGVIGAAQTAASDSNVLFADARNFIEAHSANIATALGRQDDASFQVLPGIEIQSAGDLSLFAANAPNTAGWDLSAWRFGSQSVPGMLTLRAGGNLTINRSLSDGFTGLAGSNANAAAFRLTAGDHSWSYRLIAGAEQSSADSMAIDAASDADFSIASGIAPINTTNPGTYRMVRTGTGDIQVAAADDLVFGNQQSVLYTAGRTSADGIVLGNAASGLGARTYPVDGGDIDIRVGGDISGSRSQQFVNDWLWRVGRSRAVAPTGLATAWTVNFVRFQQGIAALGGGDVSVNASGDIDGLSVSIPSIGIQTGSTQAQASEVSVVGGGDLSIRAGGSIYGGTYYVGFGRGYMNAANRIDAAPLPTANGFANLYPILGLGDGAWNLQARDSLGIETVANPTLLPQGVSQLGLASDANQSTFATYSATSNVHALSVAGDVVLSNNVDDVAAAINGFFDRSQSAGNPEATQAHLTSLGLYAPTLSVTAMSGDLDMQREMTLFPAANADAALLANGDISLGNFQQMAADPAALPSIAYPDTGRLAILNAIRGLRIESSVLAAHPLVPIHAGDSAMSRVVSRSGNISGSASPTAAPSYFATPVSVRAGRNIVDLSLVVQHDDSADVSRIHSGGALEYSVTRDSLGAIVQNGQLQITVDGPGALAVYAGGDINLQTSAGISSRGNLFNPNLPDQGASIHAIAGLQDRPPSYTAFEQRYIVGSEQHADALSNYMLQLTGARPAGRAVALDWFATLSDERKAVLLHTVLLSELRASAEYAASADPAKKNDYSRGFAALETMFPGSTGNANPYDGDLALYFSRIYTLDGGDIALLTPGGGVNVGLAAPPTSFGIRKDADRLGIVTQRGGNISLAMDGDLEVNESRMFAINDSDIVVWSSNGDIDAGRGAKTAISAPDAQIAYDRDGRATTTYSAALAGSGIQTRTSTEEFNEGDVVLAAPRGIVNAGDAGIRARNLTIAATAVLGADNIKVSGVSVGVPVDSGGLGASLSNVSNAASGATNSAAMAVDNDESSQQSAPVAEAALSWLEVFVVGLGEEGDQQNDVDRLKRPN